MVVSNIKDLKINMTESQPLKFGMDRILSEDISTNNKKIEESCKIECSSAPCAGCISSLYRCCRVTQIPVTMPQIYRNGIHTPQPLRPYTNVLIQTDNNLQINSQPSNSSGGNAKRKRSWSRAVFSNLQRKGLEKRFQIQKYITKPDRRQLAATLGLTDAQVKVWFQNRRMKWRHTKESSRQSSLPDGKIENLVANADSTQNQKNESDSGSDIDVQTIDV